MRANAFSLLSYNVKVTDKTMGWPCIFLKIEFLKGF